MPFCPECQAEYRDGFTRCYSCDVDLVDRLSDPFDTSDENVRRALEGKELVPVTRGYLDVVKETRELLAGSRIASLIVDSDEAPVHPGAPKQVLLVVGKDDIQAAAHVLGDTFQGMLDEEGLSGERNLNYQQCPACGHEVAEDREECPECGLFIGKA